MEIGPLPGAAWCCSMPWSTCVPVHTDSCQSGFSYDVSLGIDEPVKKRCELETPWSNAAASHPATSTHDQPARPPMICPNWVSEIRRLSTLHRYLCGPLHGPRPCSHTWPE